MRRDGLEPPNPEGKRFTVSRRCHLDYRRINGPHRNRTCHSLLAKQSRHLGTFQPADPAAGLEPTPQVWKTLMLPLTPCGDNDHDRIDPGLTPGTHETRKGTGRAGPPHTPGGYRPLILMRSCFAPALYRMIKTRLTFRSRYTGRSRRASTGENRNESALSSTRRGLPATGGASAPSGLSLYHSAIQGGRTPTSGPVPGGTSSARGTFCSRPRDSNP